MNVLVEALGATKSPAALRITYFGLNYTLYMYLILHLGIWNPEPSSLTTEPFDLNHSGYVAALLIFITYLIPPKILIPVRSCQIDFLFSVTSLHAKKLGALNLFIQKLARWSFLCIIGEKRTFHNFSFYQFFLFFFLINSNKPHNGLQNFILPFCLKRLLQRVRNEMFRTLLECTSEISFENYKHW